MTTTTLLDSAANPAGSEATVPSARRRSAALFIAGGLLMAAGGQLHPVGTGSTVAAHLLSMFGNPRWDIAHLILFLGGVAALLAFVTSWRGHLFGPRVQRWLPATMIGWGLGAFELVPHLLAASEAEAFAHHHSTPVIDFHLVLQVIASPAVGLTGALVAVAVARSTRTWPSRLLAVPAVVGGLLSAGAAPLVILTGDPQWTVLFPFQAGLAIWLVGTGVLLLSHRGPASDECT